MCVCLGGGGGGEECSRMTDYYRAVYTELTCILNLGLDRGH